MIDAHAHLDEVPNLNLELGRARDAGVVAVIAVGSEEKSNEAVLRIARRHPGFVLPALGLHPWSLREDFESTLKSIENNVDECVALGEVGLDFRIQKARELQIEAFKRVLEFARRFRKPVIVHSRWAWREAFELVREGGVKRAVFHWYSGPLETLRELLASGCYISATPAAEYSEPHRLALKEVPLDRLLLETDSPVAYRGMESRPSDVVRVLKAVARLKGVDGNEIADATTENVIGLFGLEL